MNKHTDVYLLVGGLIGDLALGTALDIMATINAKKHIDQAKKELNKDKLNVKEITKAIWKDILPPLIVKGLSAAAIISSNRIAAKRFADLAAMYTIAESSMQRYKEKTKEIIGEKKESQISDEVSKEATKSIDSRTYVISNEGEYVCIESITGRSFVSNWNKISNMANRLVSKSRGSVEARITESEWFDAIGLRSTSVSDEYGWDMNSNPFDIRPRFTGDENNVPVIYIDYVNRPKEL